jgi:hypothetical protein
MCTGTAPGILEDRGYLVIRQPRGGIRLLELFELDKLTLHPLNTTVESILTPAARAALPGPHPDELFTAIDGKVVREVDAGLGASILKHVIPGYDASLGAAYSRAQVFEFRFLDVYRDAIDIVKTEWALEEIASAALRGSLRSAAIQRRLFLVASLLKSSQIGVKAHAAGKVDLNAELTAEDLAKADAKLSRNHADESEIIYKGDAKLVFAIEARRLVFIDGKFRMLKIDDQPKVALAAKDETEALLGFDKESQLIKPLSVLDLSSHARSL